MSSPIEGLGAPTQLGKAYLAGELCQEPLAGEFRPTRSEDVPRVDEAADEGQREWVEAGKKSLCAGEVAFGVLAAGASTRMNLSDMPLVARRHIDRARLGVVRSKALVPICEIDGEVVTFLDLFAVNARRMNEAVGSDCPVLLLVSESNAEEIEGHLAARHEKLSVISFQQRLDNQIVATPADVERSRANFASDEDVADALDLAGTYAGCEVLIGKPAGHGEFLHQMISTGVLGRLIQQGIRFVSLRNIDNVGGILDATWLAILGRMIAREQWLTLEVSRRPDGPAGKGGALILRSNGDFQIAEDPALAGTGVSPRDSRYINDATALLAIEYLFGIYETSPEEILASDPVELAAIADRGRRKFPPLLDVKPIRLPGGRIAGAFVRETNLWESTGVAGASHIDAVAVDSVKDVEVGFETLSLDEQCARALRVRFLATKKWEDYEGINAKLIPHLARKVMSGSLLS